MSTISFRFSSSSCPVCGTDSKGCSATDDGLHLCRGEPRVGWREVSRDADELGFRYYRRDDGRSSRPGWYTRPPRPKPKPARPAAKKPARDWRRQAIAFTADLTPARRTELARSLGLPTEATYLVPFLGYVPAPAVLLDGVAIDPGYWTFPEADGAGNVVGVLRRWRKGCNLRGNDKQQFPHAGRGLSVPAGWADNPGPVFVVEGPTDAMAAAHAGLACVGRPSNTGGVEHLAELLTGWPADRDIIVVGENDRKPDGLWPGRDGAESVARKLTALLGRAVKVAFPPEDSKDVREWLTAAERGVRTWPERGAELLARLTAEARVTEADPAQAAGEPDADSPGAAAAEVIERLTPCSRCERVRVHIVERRSSGKLGAVPFGCHRTACPTCGLFRKRKVFLSTETYLPRVTDSDPQTGGKTLYAAVIPAGRLSAAVKAVRKLKGEYLAVHTTDAGECASMLAPADSGHVSVGRTYPNSPHVLLTAVVATGARVPAYFATVTVAAAFRSLGQALATTPLPPPDVRRYRAWVRSRGWGDELVKEPSDVRVVCPAAFTHEEVAGVLGELNKLVPFWFGDPTIRGRPLGIGGGPGQARCLSMLLSGNGSPTTPTVEQVTELGRDWMKVIPPEIQAGARVYGVLKEHLWTCPLLRRYWLAEQLLEADRLDRAEAEFVAEAESLLRAIREAYKGRENEARGIFAVALGIDPPDTDIPA